ncbi:MAG TPA: hypothetical protein VNH64_04585, partial [Parvularculaceae bacterium]|nr:hypothetical protein [Parvularculaceae bacterium]
MARSKPHNEPAPRRATVDVAEIGAQGDGVAFIDGEIVYVPLTAPGDRALIEARGDRATLIELVDESLHRSAPPCPHYGRCGGCALQHVTKDFCLEWKRARVALA